MRRCVCRAAGNQRRRIFQQQSARRSILPKTQLRKIAQSAREKQVILPVVPKNHSDRL